MEMNHHCDICKLCTQSEQNIGSQICKYKIINKFHDGFWHNGTEWRILKKGRVLTKSTISHTKNVRQAKRLNKDTLTFVVREFTKEHEEVLLEWSNDISGFQKEGQMDRFVFYMTTHPFSLILEYRLNGYLVGFSWLIMIDQSIIQQLFPWRKKRFTKLNLGVYSYGTEMDLWPDKLHFLGMDSEFKSKFGGWIYEGKIPPSELMNN